MTAVRRASGGSGWAVTCPDGGRRHAGLFATDIAAQHWAKRGRCCTQLGPHRVLYQRGPAHLRRPPRLEVA